MAPKAPRASIIPRPDDKEEVKSTEVKISALQDVASYNWLDEEEPSILVPGVPPVWSPPRFAPSLKPDAGTRYVDQNGDKYPWSPLEPLVRAVLEMQPDYPFDMVDLITDRRPIHHLLAFLDKAADDFAFGVEVVRNTVLFVRRERQTRDEPPPNTFQGYRQAFEEAYTHVARSAQGSTSHYRIVQYELGPLRMLVRSAFDAYRPAAEPTTPASEMRRDGSDDLIDCFKAISLQRPAPSVIDTPDTPGLAVRKGGQVVPHSALVELKTRAKYSKRAFTLQEKISDLWIAQTPTFIVASYQNAGHAYQQPPRMARFLDIAVIPVRDDITRWEQSNQRTIRQLIHVLMLIENAARALQERCMVRYRHVTDSLSVEPIDGGTVGTLPVELHDRF